MQRLKGFFLNNYQFIWCLILLATIFIVAINPSPFISSTLTGINVWATIVLPSLFCFLIFTKLLMQNNSTIKVFKVLDKPFCKLYKTPHFGGYIFAMSLISGYPIGANLISEFYEQKLISNAEAHRLCAYCSTSGPMFIIGSLALSMCNNIKVGIIVLTSHLIAALLNGLIYRNYATNTSRKLIDNKENLWQNNKNPVVEIKKQTLNNILENSITSVLMVGGFITISFTLLEIINVTNIFKPVYLLFDKILPTGGNIIKGIFSGIVELTNGCVSLTQIANLSALPLSIILSALVSFGGLSIHLQSYSFLSKCKIKYKFFLLTKITHTAISVALATFLGLFIL